MKFYPWTKLLDAGLARIRRTPAEMEEIEWRLSDGEPSASLMPPGVTYDLGPGGGIRLADAIPNTITLVFVSERLRAFLDQRARYEFHSVVIRDHKKHRIKKPYFIANLLDSIACVDRRRSDFEMNTIVKDQVLYFRRLVLDEKRIPPEARIFRLAEERRTILVREDVVQEFKDAGFTGVVFPELSELGADFRDSP